MPLKHLSCNLIEQQHQNPTNAITCTRYWQVLILFWLFGTGLGLLSNICRVCRICQLRLHSAFFFGRLFLFGPGWLFFCFSSWIFGAEELSRSESRASRAIKHFKKHPKYTQMADFVREWISRVWIGSHFLPLGRCPGQNKTKHWTFGQVTERNSGSALFRRDEQRVKRTLRPRLKARHCLTSSDS